MPRRPSVFQLRLATTKRFFVSTMKLGLMLTPTEQKAIVLLLGLFVLGCLYKVARG